MKRFIALFKKKPLPEYKILANKVLQSLEAVTYAFGLSKKDVKKMWKIFDSLDVGHKGLVDASLVGALLNASSLPYVRRMLLFYNWDHTGLMCILCFSFLSLSYISLLTHVVDVCNLPPYSPPIIPGKLDFPEYLLMVWNFCTLDNFTMYSFIYDLLDEEIRPFLQNDGGDVYVVSLVGNKLTVHYQGACGSCPSSLSGTLTGIENLLKSIEPDIEVLAT